MRYVGVVANANANAIELEMSAWAATVDTRIEQGEKRWQLFRILVVLNVLDVITTGLVLAAGGSEGNPLIAPMVDNMANVALLKFAVLAGVAALLGRCHESRVVDIGIVAVTGWYAAVIGWNLTVLAVI